MLTYRKLLALAKQLLLLRIQKALNQNWSYYARPGTCLFGPHSGVSFWGSHHDLKTVLERNGIPFNAYDSSAQHPSGQVLKLAHKLAERHQSFCDHVHDWQEVERFFFADGSTEALEADRDGNTRRVMIEAPHGDACY